MEQIETVVVGAGLAGLCAARDLLDAGRQVVLLEARDRVGGRTYSVPFEAPGLTVDLGAEWVDPDQHQAMMQELGRYGIDLEGATSKTPPQPVAPETEAGSWHSIVPLCDCIAAQLNPDQPDWYEGFDDFDLPVTAFLKSHAFDIDDVTAFLAHGFALQGAHPDEYSMLNLFHEFAAFGGVEAAFNGAESRIAGGAQSLSIAIAKTIGLVLRLDCPVTRIAKTKQGVIVEGPAGQLLAGQVIVALPLNVLPHLSLDLPLPNEAARVIAEGHVGRAAKGWAVATLSKPVESVGWPHAVEVYSRRGARSDAVCTFAVAEPDHDKALAESWWVLSARHPDIVLQQQHLSHDWIADPYSRGSWLSSAPGQMRGLHQLADMPPPVFFAGGDFSRGWYGWMEGAVTSGRDAATRALACTDDGRAPPAMG